MTKFGSVVFLALFFGATCLQAAPTHGHYRGPSRIGAKPSHGKYDYHGHQVQKHHGHEEHEEHEEHEHPHRSVAEDKRWRGPSDKSEYHGPGEQYHGQKGGQEEYGRKEDHGRKEDDNERDDRGHKGEDQELKEEEDDGRKHDEDYGRKHEEDYDRKHEEDHGRKHEEDYGRKHEGDHGRKEEDYGRKDHHRRSASVDKHERNKSDNSKDEHHGKHQEEEQHHDKHQEEEHHGKQKEEHGNHKHHHRSVAASANSAESEEVISRAYQPQIVESIALSSTEPLGQGFVDDTSLLI